MSNFHPILFPFIQTKSDYILRCSFFLLEYCLQPKDYSRKFYVFKNTDLLGIVTACK